MNPDGDRIAATRTLLFVPGDRPDRFAKAASSGADLVIIDLEDAVAPGDKDHARDNAAAWLALGNRAVVRINPPETPWYDADLAAVTEYGCPVMVPKAEDPVVLAEIAACCTLVPLVETALGIERAHEVCAVPGVVRAAFANVDLATRLGVAYDDHSRAQDVVASERHRHSRSRRGVGRIGP